jgi:hypothetical protein
MTTKEIDWEKWSRPRETDRLVDRLCEVHWQIAELKRERRELRQRLGLTDDEG